VPTLRELKQFAATPLCRREAAAARGPTRKGMFVFAAFLDVMAAWMLNYVIGLPPGSEDVWASFSQGGVVGWAALILAVIAVVPLVWALGLSASAISGEREERTLDALLMTTLDRRTLLWAKLLGRTRPPRRFLLATIPAYLCSAVIMMPGLVHIFLGSAHAGEIDAVLAIALTAAAAILAWAVLFFNLHAAAAVGLWFSARYRRTLTAFFMAAFAIFAPAAGLVFACCGAVLLAWPLLLGPSLFDELADSLDERVLGRE
jgi:hypothetical protein